MADPTSGVQTLYALSGQRSGVYIPEDLWAEVENEVLPALQAAYKRLHGEPEKKKEPLRDWDLLVANWDFQYPVEVGVTCGQCGCSSHNWQEDEPRKFLLKAASLGGLVVFECQACHARVSKRHFKDGITVETTPVRPE